MFSVSVSKGLHGVHKLHILKRSQDHFVIFSPGDSIDPAHISPDIAYLQDPVNVCNILGEKFGPQKSTIVVVSPTRFQASFAVYDAFFPKLTPTGEPLSYNGRTFKAAEQLQSLLEESGLCSMSLPSSKAATSTASATTMKISPPASIDLVGFSKGGIVLNQLLAELAESLSTADSATDSNYTSPPPHSTAFLHSLRHFHYLDAGLNCPGAYLNNPKTFLQLGRWCNGGGKNLKVVLHGTPRQWDDPHIPFLKVEKDRMVDLCRKYDIPVQVIDYFQGQKPSLNMHFAILTEMKVGS